jgi:DNA-binding PucR family transcriptional regulator
MERHLSPLDNYRCPGVTLRKTLREYFAAGRNASAAALVLNISRRTMRNRMVLIEESLGYRLKERQAELELALRLEALQNAAPHNPRS